MGILCTVAWTGTVTNAGGNVDLVEVLPADDKPCKIRGILLSQISEVADAAEEGLSLTIYRLRATVTSGSGGSSASDGGALNNVDPSGTAAGFAAEYNNTTVATTSGNSNAMAELGWNIRNSPFDFWMPDERFAPKGRQGDGLIVRQNTTAADDYTGCFTFWIEEE